MPSRHRYKCLNYQYCPAYNSAGRDLSHVFDAMNSPQPTCPHCGSIKVEDWGIAVNPMIGGQGGAKQMDTHLKQTADQYGMTNMNNRNGNGVKAVTGEARGDLGKINVNGVMVPVDHNPTCSRVPMSSPLKVETGSRMPGRNSIPTKVVAAHRA